MSESNTAKEVEERVALLTRLRDNLLKQREKFEEYLLVLEEEETAISNRDSERLSHLVELESRIIADIGSVQKVVAPLSELYRDVTSDPDPEILDLEASLGRLHREATERNLRNQELLRGGLETLRQEIASVARPQRAVNVYSSRGTATLLDIST